MGSRYKLSDYPPTAESKIKTIDARGWPLAKIDAIGRQHPAHLFRMIGIDYSHDTTDNDIREFKDKAIKAGAILIVIQEYGQGAYIPRQ